MLGASAKKGANVNQYFDYQKELKLPLTSNLNDFQAYDTKDIKNFNNLNPDVMKLEIPERYLTPLEVTNSGLVSHVS